MERADPRRLITDSSGRSTEITVVTGGFGDVVATPPHPPPDSWASRQDADVAIWHLVFQPGAACELPSSATAGVVRTVYVFEGDAQIGGGALVASTGVALDGERPVTLTAGPAGAEVLVLQGRPIAEPVAQYGPFVMNDQQGIEQAFADYRRTGFGGWPWPTDDPVHPREAGRFARRPDGHVERPPVSVG